MNALETAGQPKHHFIVLRTKKGRIERSDFGITVATDQHGPLPNEVFFQQANIEGPARGAEYAL